KDILILERNERGRICGWNRPGSGGHGRATRPARLLEPAQNRMPDIGRIMERNGPGEEWRHRRRRWRQGGELGLAYPGQWTFGGGRRVAVALPGRGKGGADRPGLARFKTQQRQLPLHAGALM